MEQAFHTTHIDNDDDQILIASWNPTRNAPYHCYRLVVPEYVKTRKTDLINNEIRDSCNKSVLAMVEVGHWPVNSAVFHPAWGAVPSIWYLQGELLESVVWAATRLSFKFHIHYLEKRKAIAYWFKTLWKDSTKTEKWDPHNCHSPPHSNSCGPPLSSKRP